MVDITFLEVHLDDSTLTANAPFSSTGGESEEETEAEAEVEVEVEEGEGGGSSTLLAAIVGLVFLVVVGFLVRRYLRGGQLDERAAE